MLVIGATALAQLAEYGVEVVAAALAVVLIWAVRRGVRWVERRLDVEVSGANEALLEQLTLKAVDYAEEKGRQYAKRVDRKLPGPEKLEVAAQWLIRQAQARDWDELGKREAVDLIESVLPRKRAAEGPVPGFMEEW